jgi:uncharacterized protein
MKNIVLIGASGFIGSVILKEALNRGHRVTSVVRHPEKITLTDPNMVAKRGDILLSDTVPDLVYGADVVISAYNPGWTNPNIATDTTRGYISIIKGVKESGIKRLLVVGGAGSLFVSPGLRLMDAGMIPENYLPAVRALANVYLELLSSEKDLDWAFFSPAADISHGTRTGKFRLGKDDMISDSEGKSHISVEDYAVAMIDETENPVHHQERFTIGY